MVDVEVVYVFARDEVYLGIPIAVECVECGKLLCLSGGKLREVSGYCLHA